MHTRVQTKKVAPIRDVNFLCSRAELFSQFYKRVAAPDFRILSIYFPVTLYWRRRRLSFRRIQLMVVDGQVTQFPELKRRAAACGLEPFNEITKIVETDRQCDFADGEVGAHQQVDGSLESETGEIIHKGAIKILLEIPAEIFRRKAKRFRSVSKTESFAGMAADKRQDGFQAFQPAFGKTVVPAAVRQEQAVCDEQTDQLQKRCLEQKLIGRPTLPVKRVDCHQF